MNRTPKPSRKPTPTSRKLSKRKESTMDWDAFFKAMIAEEHAAYKKYAAAAQQTDEPALKKLLEQFQYEESVHADLLESEYGRWRKKQA
jgi:rubrerythrin